MIVRCDQFHARLVRLRLRNLNHRQILRRGCSLSLTAEPALVPDNQMDYVTTLRASLETLALNLANVQRALAPPLASGTPHTLRGRAATARSSRMVIEISGLEVKIIAVMCRTS